VSDPKLSEDIRELADHCRRMFAPACLLWFRAWLTQRDWRRAADCYAAWADRAEALEARAALAEARLAALSRSQFMHVPGEWTQLMDGMPSEESGLSWPQFDSLLDLADTLRAQALGCTVEELPERKERT
jgi:hypothetical protein